MPGDAVPPPLHDAQWDDRVPRAAVTRPDDQLVAGLMRAEGLSKPDAEDVVATDPERAEYLIQQFNSRGRFYRRGEDAD